MYNIVNSVNISLYASNIPVSYSFTSNNGLYTVVEHYQRNQTVICENAQQQDAINALYAASNIIKRIFNQSVG